MIRCFAIVAGALVAVSVFSAQVHGADITGVACTRWKPLARRPTTSPYLNLVAVDNFGIAGGYQTLVRPFVDSRKAINANSAAISRLQSGGGSAAGYYMNYSQDITPTFLPGGVAACASDPCPML